MKLRKIVSVVLLISTLMASTMTAEAATYGSAASSGNYNNYVGKESVGTHTHYIYKHSSNWILYYTGKKLTPVVYHTKYSGPDELTFSISQTIETVKTVNWSANVSISKSASVGVGEIFESGVEVTADLGFGYGTAYGKSYTSSSSVNKTIKDEAPTGYYTRVPGRTFYKMKDLAVYTSRSSMDTFYYDMPYGSMVIYTLYSRYNDSWSIY